MTTRSLIITLALTIPGFVLAQQTPTRPPITGISHVTLYADDIEKSKQFYSSLLGWEPVPSNSTKSGVRFYANHEQYVQLDSAPGPGLENRLESVGFSTSDVEGLRKYLESRGISVPEKVTKDKEGDRSIQLYDPEGNAVEFVQQSRPPAEPKSAAQRLSTHIIHAGYVVRNRKSLDYFYKDVLGFHLYWQGGNPPTQVDWVMMQVPDGTDWFEYMLNLPEAPTMAQLGSANHLSPGVVSVEELQQKLEQRGWKPAGTADPKILGVDGKMQLDLNDPDGTRVEFMEFKPVKTPCCSPVTGKDPVPSETW